MNNLRKWEEITVKSQKEGTATILTAHPEAKKIEFTGKSISKVELDAQKDIWKKTTGTKIQYHTIWDKETNTILRHPADGAHATTPHIHVRQDDIANNIYKETVVLIEK